MGKRSIIKTVLVFLRKYKISPRENNKIKLNSKFSLFKAIFVELDASETKVYNRHINILSIMLFYSIKLNTLIVNKKVKFKFSTRMKIDLKDINVNNYDRFERQ